ncbi:unnamed protein product [Vitrella brassicaformis CCMP3155]|uniref:RING-type domain-containing protein n=1 Tax=Vitrella brassicaformis (strain CCMP3155) TaxID=1169540 RepID=A0A0G4G6G0_VITBC|nr:unnamed protein product [Vitrella brassicaformis CCMP3155]|eukprot:CEM23845.1 unnamed protein product [Vitrella brassicaformis CCMP3155]
MAAPAQQQEQEQEEPPNVARLAFNCKCERTNPGESVNVRITSPDDRNLFRAVRLTTTPVAWPQWKSSLLDFDTQDALNLNYKYFLQNDVGDHRREEGGLDWVPARALNETGGSVRAVCLVRGYKTVMHDVWGDPEETRVDVVEMPRNYGQPPPPRPAPVQAVRDIRVLNEIMADLRNHRNNQNAGEANRGGGARALLQPPQPQPQPQLIPRPQPAVADAPAAAAAAAAPAAAAARDVDARNAAARAAAARAAAARAAAAPAAAAAAPAAAAAASPASSCSSFESAASSRPSSATHCKRPPAESEEAKGAKKTMNESPSRGELRTALAGGSMLARDVVEGLPLEIVKEVLAERNKEVEMLSTIVGKKEYEQSNMCVVCMEARKEVVLLPCRHQCICRDCANKLRQGPASWKCPMCQQMANEIIVVFIP